MFWGAQMGWDWSFQTLELFCKWREPQRRQAATAALAKAGNDMDLPPGTLDVSLSVQQFHLINRHVLTASCVKAIRKRKQNIQHLCRDFETANKWLINH